MGYATSFDGTQLWFDTLGTVGTPILLIAGNGCDHDAWRIALPELSRAHRVIYFDHRGTGRSDAAFPDEWSTRDFARDAVTILDALGIQRAHVYGHSMGGRIAQWFAIDYPERVGALILGATSPGDRHGVARTVEATVALSSGDPVSMQRLCFTESWIGANPELARSGAPNPRDRRAFQMHLTASTEHDAWRALPTIVAPTLVIHGSDDTLTLPTNAERLIERIPGSRLLMIEGARHIYWAGFPEAHHAVLQFVDQHPL